MSQILLVEDDDCLRDIISKQLVSSGYKVTSAANGKAARDLIAAGNFGLVISDMKMPFLTGIELLEWSNTNVKVPFIFMSGFSTEKEIQQAEAMGGASFLKKPFCYDKLTEEIKKIIPDKEEKPAVDLSSKQGNYCKVSIDEFVAKPSLNFNVYVGLTKTKYVCIGRAGTVLSTNRIATYKEKGIKYLYISKEDFPQLVNFNLQVGKVLQNNKSINPEKKMNFMKYTGEAILEKAFINGVDKKSFEEASEYLQMTVSLLSEHETSVDLLSLLNSHSDYIYAKSLATSLYSIMIARKMGYESTQVFFKLSMAGMFHDIGLKEIAPSILEKPRHLLTHEERSLFEKHPIRTREILDAVGGIPEDVFRLVSEHHEDCLGQGYPLGTKESKQHPLSKIFQLACIFLEYAMVSPTNPDGRSPKDAIRHIENVYMDRVDPKCLQGLREMFNSEFVTAA